MPPATAIGAAWLRAAGWLLDVLALLVATVAVLAFEPPRVLSPQGYARQLLRRLVEIQAVLDADDRRRPGEGKEKEDDRVPSEP